MSEYLSKHTKLLVVSDTGMYVYKGRVYAFGPVVRELEALLTEFESIVWIGYDRSDQLDNYAYTLIESPKMTTVILKRLGGKSILDKLSIIWHYPKMFIRIQQLVLNHQKMHIRAPSHPAVIAMLLAKWYPKKQFWFKYAGSWVEPASFFYSLQRRILKGLKHQSKVTVNGLWLNQKPHIISFENPCLTIQDRELGFTISELKTLHHTPEYCFVGGLNDNKGIEPLIEAFRTIPPHLLGVIHIVGEGVLKSKIIDLSKKFQHKVIFHGHLSKEQIITIYSKSHFIVLPSKSEGFPKVISEAMNYGCVPLVSNISCIGQYIEHEKNGFLIVSQSVKHIQDAFKWSLNMKNDDFQLILKNNYKLAERFTYERYIKRIREELYINT